MKIPTEAYGCRVPCFANSIPQPTGNGCDYYRALRAAHSKKIQNVRSMILIDVLLKLWTGLIVI